MDIQTAITGLATGGPAAKVAAAEWCAEHADEAAAAATTLVSQLGSDNSALREWCTAALESLGPPPDDQLARLAELVRSDVDDIAYWAITLLGRSGPAARPYIPALEAAAEGARNDVLKRRATWALGKAVE